MKNKNLFSFFISFLLVILSCIFIYYSFTNNYINTTNSDFFKHFGKNLGSFSEVCFFIVIALFVLRLIIKNFNKKGISRINKILNIFKLEISESTQVKILDSQLTINIRKFLLYVNKILSKFHVLIAMVAIAVITIHGYIFLQLGFKWSLGYILGVLALLNLVVLLFSGYLRIFNKGIHIHKFLGISFIILMLLHIALV